MHQQIGHALISAGMLTLIGLILVVASWHCFRVWKN